MKSTLRSASYKTTEIALYILAISRTSWFFILILLLSSSCSESHSSLTLMADRRVNNSPIIYSFIQYIISRGHDHEIKTHTMFLSRRTQMWIVTNLHKPQKREVKWGAEQSASCGKMEGYLLWTQIKTMVIMIHVSLQLSSEFLSQELTCLVLVWFIPQCNLNSVVWHGLFSNDGTWT